MAQCQHKRRGIVTNQPEGYDSTRPHASTSVCDKPECISAAIKWVAGQTNETAVHVSDASRRSAA